MPNFSFVESSTFSISMENHINSVKHRLYVYNLKNSRLEKFLKISCLLVLVNAYFIAYFKGVAHKKNKIIENKSEHININLAQ